MRFASVKKKCKPYSMAFGGGRAEFLYDAVRKILDEDIPGDLVECGVWKGGNIALMAGVCKEQKSDRTIWAYDTYEGMPPAGPYDEKLDGSKPSFQKRNNLAISLSEVQSNVTKVSSYPHIHYVKGKVQETIPYVIPNQIAFLRLDTDFYASTKHELTHLYPLLSPRGILIIDDYHCWRGSQKACDEYFPDKKWNRIGRSNAVWRTK